MRSYRKWMASAALAAGMIGTGALVHSELEVSSAYAQRSAPASLTDASIPDVAERVVDSVVNI